MFKFVVSREIEHGTRPRIDYFVIWAQNEEDAIAYMRDNNLEPHVSEPTKLREAVNTYSAELIESYNRRWDYFKAYHTAMQPGTIVIEGRDEHAGSRPTMPIPLALEAIEAFKNWTTKGPDDTTELPRIGYKVTRDGKSVFIRIEGALDYPSREWVFPKDGCGPLAVFDTYEHARTWLALLVPDKRQGVFRIRECSYFPSRKSEMWIGSGEKKLRMANEIFPPGTVLAHAVFCLE